jgi:hypothetical protein
MTKRAPTRFIIAIDENGVYLRKTLCVTHHGDTGEVTYNAIPIDRLKVPEYIRLAFELVTVLLLKRQGK